MYIGLAAVMVTNVASLPALAAAVLPAGSWWKRLGAAFGLANLVGTVLVLLAHPVPADARHLVSKAIGVALIRMHIAAVPAAIFALAVTFAVGVVLSPRSKPSRIFTVVVGGSGALLLYVLFARALGITEVGEITTGLRSRLGRDDDTAKLGAPAPPAATVTREVTVCPGAQHGLRRPGMARRLRWCTAASLFPARGQIAPGGAEGGSRACAALDFTPMSTFISGTGYPPWPAATGSKDRIGASSGWAAWKA